MAPAGTRAILELRSAGVPFTVHEFERHDRGGRGYGLVAADALGVDPDRVFKTLVARTDTGLAVAVVPVSCQLSLRLLAAALGAKRAEMCPVDLAERTTGYVAGGISPFGQRKRLPTVVDETCDLFDTVFVSGGRRGLDLEVAPGVFRELLDATVAAIAS